jgi:hypothetical protein
MFMMFKKNYINPKLSKYIKEENNKWLKKYSNISISKNDVRQRFDYLVKQKMKNIDTLSFFNIVLTSFSFIIFFTAGYNSMLIK